MQVKNAKGEKKVRERKKGKKKKKLLQRQNFRNKDMITKDERRRYKIIDK